MTELITRAAGFASNTFNADTRTVDVIFSTGADVTRHDFEGQYIERLAMDSTAADLSELIGGPVLDNHDRFSGVRSVLGVVQSAAVDGKQGTAKLQFSARPEVAGVMQDVEAGIIRSVSVGYSVREWKTYKEANGVRVKLATKWTPKEISFTPLPADKGAKVRSQQMELQEQIQTIATVMGLPAEFAQRTFATIEEARTAAVTEAAKRTPVIDNRAPATITREANDGVVSRMADALVHRMDPTHKVTDGREFLHYGFGEIARRCLELRGLSTLGSRIELIERALHTTSDFSAVLQESYNKQLLTFNQNPVAIAQLFKRATVSDFRTRHVLEISDGPALEKVNEKGEVKYGSITDKELSNYKIDSYAKAFGVTFKVLINDDMNALNDISMKATAGARRWFASFLVDTFTSNPKLADNVAVFHASHGNLAASGAVPSDTTISAAKLAIRMQKDASGNPIDATPRFIVAPAALETTIDKLLATLYPAQAADAQVAIRNLTPVIESRLDAKSLTAWYLFCSPSEAPVFEYSELSGYEGPRAETRTTFETLGVEVRVVWHLGAGAIDSRGAWKNPGA